MPIRYSDAGVNIDAANTAKDRIKRIARHTFNQRTLSDIGSFGGMFDGRFPLMRSPVLVASADGVGTKLKIAFETAVHNTVGRDLVNHCVNDILVQGAHPLFFMDYLATGKLEPEIVVSVVEGIARGCKENDCVLLGGETAEMPGFYAEGEYDLAGFILGVVDRDKIIDGRHIKPGDIILGLRATGLHTNGYSLARKLFFETAGYKPNTYIEEFGSTLAVALLEPHPSYLRALEPLLPGSAIKGLVHITGGGLIENIPRVLPEGMGASIMRSSWPVPQIFQLMQEIGTVPDDEMFRTFNMGIGMALICSPEDRDEVISGLSGQGQTVYEIGLVTKGAQHVELA